MKNGFEFRWRYKKEDHWVIVRVNRDSNYEGILEAFRAFSKACGYSETVVDRYFKEEIDVPASDGFSVGT